MTFGIMRFDTDGLIRGRLNVHDLRVFVDGTSFFFVTRYDDLAQLLAESAGTSERG